MGNEATYQLPQLIQIIAALMTVAMFLSWLFQSSAPSRVRSPMPNAHRLFRLIRLRQQSNNRKKLWKILRETTIFMSLVLLALDTVLAVVLVGALVVEGTDALNFGTIVFLILMFLLPILLLIDDYKTELRVRRGKRSRVFKQAKIEIAADYDSLLIRCLQVVSDMGARITSYNAVAGHLLAELPKNIITIKIKQSQDETYIVYVSSDTDLPSVRFDFGHNQRNVDECVKRLLGYK